MEEETSSFDRRRSERSIIIFLSILGTTLVLWIIAIGVVGLRH
jgi:hypothetical protein